MLIPSVNSSLNELIGLLHQLSNTEYSKPCPALSQASIGEHTRHVVEMFQCLEKCYDCGVVNYDKRERNVAIQTNTRFAVQAILFIQGNLNKADKAVELRQFIDGEEIRIDSSYNRELRYNLEHCIHHQALIKVAILQSDNIKINADFGVSRSTIQYRNQCAQ